MELRQTKIQRQNGGRDEYSLVSFDDDLETEKDRENDEDDDILQSHRWPTNGQGVRFQHHQEQRAHLDSQQYIKPLVNSQLLQSHHHRLSRTSLLGSCKSVDYCYADER